MNDAPSIAELRRKLELEKPLDRSAVSSAGWKVRPQ